MSMLSVSRCVLYVVLFATVILGACKAVRRVTRFIRLFQSKVSIGDSNERTFRSAHTSPRGVTKAVCVPHPAEACQLALHRACMPHRVEPFRRQRLCPRQRWERAQHIACRPNMAHRPAKWLRRNHTRMSQPSHPLASQYQVPARRRVSRL